MATAAPPLGSIERGSDWLNPILVKETRQALKSRQFVATFLLMLMAAWMISVFGILLAGEGAEYRPLGGGFFFSYYVVLAVAVFLIVPFGAFRSLLAERDLHAWEVLSITTLRPRQIVAGKLLSSVVQIFIYYSAITPFMAFAKLLKGIDVPTIAFVLVASLGWSIVLSMVALTISTLGSQRFWQVFLTLAVLGGLLFSLIVTLQAVGGMMAFGGGFEFEAPEFWWATAIVASMVIGYCLLLLQVAIAQLTFDADNRTTGVRLAASGVFWMSMLWAFVGTSLGGSWRPFSTPADISRFIALFSVVMSLHWIVVGLFTVTESDVLSRRVRRSLSRLGPFRLLLAPFLPGGARGYLYLLIHLAALYAFIAGVLTLHGGYDEKIMYFVSGLLCYVVVYMGLGSAAGRWLRLVSQDFRPAHARVTTVLALALGAIFPYLLLFFDRYRNGGDMHPFLWLTDPFSTLIRLSQGNSNSPLIMLVLAIAALVVVAINLRGIFAGVAEVAHGYPVGPTAPPAAAGGDALTAEAMSMPWIKPVAEESL